jgi:60 kDa SS-A/Ro ribonucleoprotein
MRKVMKALEGSTKVGVYAGADTKNKEGTPAWTQSSGDGLRQMCFCGQLGDSFYAKAEEHVDVALDIFQKADPQELRDAIVLGRNEGFMRTVNILGLIVLSQKDPRLFRTAFQDVIRTGNDLGDYMEMNRKIRKFGRSVKTAMQDWVDAKCNAFYAVKYRKQIADAIRLSKKVATTPSQLYTLAMYPRKKEIDMEKLLKAEPQLRAFEDCKVEMAAGKVDNAANLIIENDLDVTSLVSQAPKGLWKALAKKMPTMMFLKYMAKLDREEVLTVELVHEKLTAEKLNKAKVFPFRLYIAYENITNMGAKNALAEVLEEYVGRYDWDVFNKYTWAIGPDVSGSMTRPVEGSTMTPAIVAGLFSSFFYKGLNDALLLPWSTEIHTGLVGPKRDSVLTQLQRTALHGGGGTAMNLVPQHLREKKIKVDKVYLITDSMDWSNPSYGFVAAWEDYHKFNPKAQAILHRVDAHNTKPFSDKQSKELNIVQIFGWSDNVVKYLQYKLA